MSDMRDTRRSALAGAALSAAAALGGREAMAQAGARKTFVLIHGAYHGGWCWKNVTAILEKQGHKVYAPSLTGLADRSHLLSMNVKLDTHITDIVNLFKWEDIKDACLVPHSYGGWPASGALEQIGDRVSSIVWLDAFMPKNGESQHRPDLPVQPQGAGRGAGQGRARPQAAEGEPVFAQREGLRLDELQADGPAERRVPEPIKLTGALQKVAKKTFIRAPKYPQAAFDQRAGGMQGQSGVEDLRRRELAPRRHDRSAGMAGRYPDEAVVTGRYFLLSSSLILPLALPKSILPAKRSLQRRHGAAHVLHGLGVDLLQHRGDGGPASASDICLRQVGRDDLDLGALRAASSGRAALVIKLGRFLALLDHLLEQRHQVGLVERLLALPARLDVGVLDRRVHHAAASPTRRSSRAFIASFMALLMLSRSTGGPFPVQNRLFTWRRGPLTAAARRPI